MSVLVTCHKGSFNLESFFLFILDDFGDMLQRAKDVGVEKVYFLLRAVINFYGR